MKRIQWPTWFLLFAMASLAVNPRFVLPILAPGYASPWWEPLQHSLLLLVLAFNALIFGRNSGVVPWPALVVSLFLVLGPFAGAAAPPDLAGHLKLGYALSAWGLLSLPWLTVLPRCSRADRHITAYAVVWLTFLSAGMGLLLHFTTDWSAYRVWDGTLYRFAGATRADYFAALAYGGVVAAVHAWNRRGSRVMGFLGVLNAILLIFSGSRTALFAFGVWLVCYTVLSPTMRARVAGLRSWLWLGIGSVAVAFVVYFPVLRSRMFGVDGGGVNLSGRAPIWETLIGYFQTRPWFGVGLGSAQPGALHDLLPHNEYLRLLVEIGIFGTALYLGAVLLWTRQVARMLRAEDRPYLVALMLALPLYALTDNPLSACYITPFLYLGTLMPGPKDA